VRQHQIEENEVGADAVEFGQRGWTVAATATSNPSLRSM
jgi:hypothetical protein